MNSGTTMKPPLLAHCQGAVPNRASPGYNPMRKTVPRNPVKPKAKAMGIPTNARKRKSARPIIKTSVGGKLPSPLNLTDVLDHLRDQNQTKEDTPDGDEKLKGGHGPVYDIYHFPGFLGLESHDG